MNDSRFSFLELFERLRELIFDSCVNFVNKRTRKSYKILQNMFRSRFLLQTLTRQGLKTRNYAAVKQIKAVNQLKPTKNFVFCSTATNSKVENPAEKHEFQAETKKLLDIVAKSLYSEKEVFIRELISNASDAIEKFRYFQATNLKKIEKADRNLEIRIDCDKIGRKMTISDSGVGMSKSEMIENLGTIARSGSKAFMEHVQEKGETDSNTIIGQFGVGFYSAFMVADKIEVYSKSCEENSPIFHWESDGTGTYTIAESTPEDFETGTKVIIHLKEDCAEFADYNTVRDIIKKYSSFVGTTLYLDGNQANDLQPVWLMEPKKVESEMHEDFYRYIAQSHDKPRFTHHFRTDSPIDIRALLYVPDSK